MKILRLLQIGFCAVLLVFPKPGHATSELHKHQAVGLVGEYMFLLNAGFKFTFGIDNSGQSAFDAIIDVFSYPDRGFIAEARPSYEPEIGYSPAIVTLPVSNKDKKVYVIVRPVGNKQGQVTLRGTRTSTSWPISYGTVDLTLSFQANPGGQSSRVTIPSGLVVGTHVWTTEENVVSVGVPSTPDTILMVLQDDVPLAFDDDSGVARMSWLHLFQPCVTGQGHSCEIIVAQRSTDKSGRSPGDAGYEVPPSSPSNRRTTIAWDEDKHNGRDQDGDSLGDALEVFIGTDKTKVDTDLDGIPDGVEVMGRADNPNNEETAVNDGRYPLYGADPLKKDLFVEADWTPACVDTDPRCTPSRKTGNRLTQDRAKRIAQLFPPEIAVHIDCGFEDPTGGTDIGAWGGAQMLSDEAKDTKNYCTGANPSRKGYFAHGLAKGAPQNAGRCTALGGGSSSTDAHELGHYTGLMHWGDKEGTAGILNCKPHYFSIMNYNYQFLGDPNQPNPAAQLGPGAPLGAFSRGFHRNLVLNPSALNEGVGLGDNPPSVVSLAFLEAAAGFKPEKDATGNYTGAVDWNGNGTIDPGLVGAAINTPGPYNGDCEQSGPVPRANFDHFKLALPTLSVENGVLQLTGILPRLGPIVAPLLLVGLQPNLSGCAKSGLDACASWPAAASGDIVWPTPPPGAFAPAVAGNVVVYADQNGKLYYFHKAAGKLSVSVAQVGGPAISGDPVAIQRPSGLVTVYAPSNGTLRRWDYDPYLAAWVLLGAVENWAPVGGAAPVPVSMVAGMGLTWGYQRNLPGEPLITGPSLYAAIRTTSNGAPPNDAMLARLDVVKEQKTTTGLNQQAFIELVSNWVPLVALGLPAKVQPYTPSKPDPINATRLGLAFRPDDPNAAEPKPGRFYLTWQFDRDNVGGTLYENQPAYTFSRGNIYSAVQSLSGVQQGLVFDRWALFGNSWTSWAGGASLAYFDGSVRGVYQTQPNFARSGTSPPVVYDPMTNPKSSFFPNVDGIFNFDERDHDDVTYMQDHLASALKQ